jgi:transposase-like protein
MSWLRGESVDETDGAIMPAPYPPEFRRRAVELARRGDRPIAVLAQRLQISESCLRRWVDQADVDDNGSDSRLTSAEKRELAQLRRQARRLELENEILKQALAYCARENILGSVAVKSAAEEPHGTEVDAAAGF